MAVVEKRKHPFVALLTNHIMFSVICAFIVMPMAGMMKTFVGVIMAIIYYMSLYDYSLREAVYHKRPYTEMTESYKYAIVYALISILFIALPVAALLIYESVWTRLFYIVFDSLFTFTPLFVLGEDICSFSPLVFIAIAAINFGFSFLGYYHGLKDNSIAKIINKYVYGGKQPVKKKGKK